MLTTVLYAAMLLQVTPDLSKDDVSAILAAAVQASLNLPGKPPVDPRPAPLMIDMDDAVQRFETLTTEPVTSADIRFPAQIMFQKVPIMTALSCPDERRITPQCRMRTGGTLVHLIDVRRNPGENSLELRVNVVYARPADPLNRLSGYTAKLRAVRVGGSWEATLVAIAAG